MGGGGLGAYTYPPEVFNKDFEPSESGLEAFWEF